VQQQDAEHSPCFAQGAAHSRRFFRRRVERAMVCLGFAFLTIATSANAQAVAEWTILVFMNGDNNLERYAIVDFAEMARVGSTDKVNIVVQFDRIGKYSQGVHPRWTGTLRFRVSKNHVAWRGQQSDAPDPATAIADLGEQNMGDGAVIGDFVKWGTNAFPAQRYALIIWDHGQGYRLPDQAPTATPFRSTDLGPYRSVSNDETNGDKLFNAEVASSLDPRLTGARLSLLGFDACLMAMVETAYSMRTIADVLVGSQDLEPAAGWDYQRWLGPTVANPTIDAEGLASAIVAAYKTTYPRGDAAITLSAVRLGSIQDVASALSRLADRLSDVLERDPVALRRARLGIRQYAKGHHFPHVDIGRLCERLSAMAVSESVAAACQAVEEVLAKSIVANYASQSSTTDHGSRGLAIYFPLSERAYLNDKNEAGGYRKGNTLFPVAFVEEQRWADFLHRYFAKVPK
jgi:hypothetical protein